MDPGSKDGEQLLPLRWRYISDNKAEVSKEEVASLISVDCAGRKTEQK